MFYSNYNHYAYLQSQQARNIEEFEIPKIKDFKRGSYHVAIAYFIRSIQQASENMVNQRIHGGQEQHEEIQNFPPHLNKIAAKSIANTKQMLVNEEVQNKNS